MEAEADGYEPVSGETLIPGGVKIIGVTLLPIDLLHIFIQYLRFYSRDESPLVDGYYRLVIEKGRITGKG